MAVAVAVEACMESPWVPRRSAAPEACGIAPALPPKPRTSPSAHRENAAAGVRRGENQDTRRTLYLGSGRATTTIYSVQPVDFSRTDCRRFALTRRRNGVAGTLRSGSEAKRRRAHRAAQARPVEAFAGVRLAPRGDVLVAGDIDDRIA